MEQPQSQGSPRKKANNVFGLSCQRLLCLTLKNCKVRASPCTCSCCITGCEIIFPIVIAFLFGFTHVLRTSAVAQDSVGPVQPTAPGIVWEETFNFPRSYIDRIANKKVIGLVSNKLNKAEQLLGNELLETIKDHTGSVTTQWVTNTSRTEKGVERCTLTNTCSWFALLLITKVKDDLPKKFTVEYKIRMARSFKTSEDFRSFNVEQNQTLKDVIVELSYLSPVDGFTYLQAYVDRGIQEFIKLKKGGPIISESTEFVLTRMPYRTSGETVDDTSGSNIGYFIALNFMVLVFSLVRVNTEKSTGFKELLRMHGVSSWIQWMAWLLSSTLVYIVMTGFVTLCLVVNPSKDGRNYAQEYDFDGLLLWLLIFLLALSVTTYSYFVSVFFQKVWSAACVGAVGWVTLCTLSISMDKVFKDITFGDAIGIMLLPGCGFLLGMKIMLNGGGRFDTMFSQVNKNVGVNLVTCYVMLIVSNVIFMTLTMYLDNIIPSKYGIAKPFYYIFMPSEWGFELKGKPKYSTAPTATTPSEPIPNNDEPVLQVQESQGPGENRSTTNPKSVETFGSKESLLNPTDDKSPFEQNLPNLSPAIVINDLVKQFGRKSKPAVNGLNAKMFNREVFALLGHNGAGKTTAISVLCGMLKPTKGTAKILGYDMNKEMELIRKHIGLCPQHNLLFEELNILDQVSLFGKLKGLKSSEARKSAIELLSWLNMSDKLKYKPGQLSGGQKRRVHLAIALIGDTKLVFLDEPTSGLDPETRREVWDVLLRLRGHLTVVLTTHHMEEADILGDRIGIMAEGKMICSGTPAFLKKHYGAGYNLKMSISSSCNPEAVTQLVKKYVLHAGAPHIGTASTLAISLPTMGLHMSKLADLMAELRAKKDNLGVDNIGLSLSTMDEVFIKAGESFYHAKIEEVDKTKTVAHSSHVPENPIALPVIKVRRNPFVIGFNRYLATFLKRMKYFINDPLPLIAMVLGLVTTFLLVVYFFSWLIKKMVRNDQPAKVIDFGGYASPVTLFEEIGPQPLRYEGIYKSVVKGFKKVKKPLITELLEKSAKPNDYGKHYIIAGFINSNSSFSQLTGYFSPFALHAPPLSLNALSRANIKRVTGVNAVIKVTNHPLRSLEDYPGELFKIFAKVAMTVFSTLIAAMMLIVMGNLTSTVAILPVEEILNKGKQLQLMSGMSPLTYWVAMFTWDFLFFTVINTLLTLTFVISDLLTGISIYTNTGGEVMIFVGLELFSFSAIWFCYLVSWLPCLINSSSGFLIVNLISATLGLVTGVILFWSLVVLYPLNLIMNINLTGTIYGIRYVLWFIPFFELFQVFQKLPVITFYNGLCNVFPEDVLTTACNKYNNLKSTDFVRECCVRECGSDCFKKLSYFDSKLSILDIIPNHPMTFDGVIVDYAVLFFTGLIFAATLLVLEYLPSIQAYRNASDREMVFPRGRNIFDDDVLGERLRVEEIIKGGPAQILSQALVAFGLEVNFKNFIAVNDLSFGVHHGECFGLLGVNGAGKTTTFRMLTGDLFPKNGRMHLGRFSFYKNRDDFLSCIGYCPQFDGIIGALTGREMVMFYGALRGVPYRTLGIEADAWLYKFGLLDAARRKCEGYSGGMKRRLSAAMALIGNPKILLLDEPTTGVDPVSRRQFWNVIKLVQQSGQSVILTSHTMDECEALCTRLAIMVNGQFQCLGDVQHLKSKFGQGFSLSIKLKILPEESDPHAQIESLNQEITTAFHPCDLKDRHNVDVQYHVLNTSLWYSDIIRKMEEIKKTNNIIEEYSVAESSLEDVFISFARNQVGPNLKTGISTVTTVAAPTAPQQQIVSTEPGMIKAGNAM